MPIVIVAAFKEELRPLLRRIRGVRRKREGISGFLDENEVLIRCCGEGGRNATAAAEALDRELPDARLIVIGVAGALSPSLEAGDTVVASRVLGEGSQIDLDPPGSVAAVKLDGAYLGTVVTVDAVLTSAEEKAKLWKRLGCPKVAVVDMESYPFAAAAMRRRRTATIIRVVSDTAEEELPVFLAHCRDPNGGIDRRRVIAHAMRHPSTIPRLAALRRRVSDGADRLAESVVSLISSETVPCA